MSLFSSCQIMPFVLNLKHPGQSTRPRGSPSAVSFSLSSHVLSSFRYSHDTYEQGNILQAAPVWVFITELIMAPVPDRTAKQLDLMATQLILWARDQAQAQGNVGRQ